MKKSKLIKFEFAPAFGIGFMVDEDRLMICIASLIITIRFKR